MSKGKYLAEFEIYIMLALARLEDEAYGVSIRQEIEERTGRPVSIGAVYATLGRLEDKGMVRHRVSDPLPVQGGRSRKYFDLTAPGREALRHSTEMLGRMMQGVDLAPRVELGEES
ncbi:MAG TPA: helix-turn-helix transcriptional regulator [Acidobacteriota bacterium]|nr:helix-turn-helix transcriptional regulator [Acidobacteriota bacterium]